MLSLILRTLVLTATIHVYAQTTGRPNAACNTSGSSSFQWAFNSLGQSPCMIAGSLAGVCNGGNISIPALEPAEFYPGPSKEDATTCQCNSVFYSILSACAACQSGDILSWSTYTTNCTSPSIQTFPSGIPPGTPVPHYAFQNVMLNDTFDVLTAEGDAGNPESTALPTPTSAPQTPTSASLTLTSVHSTSPSPSAKPQLSEGKRIGFLFVALIGMSVFLCLLRCLCPSWCPEPRPNFLAGAR
ncbi:hypothetical protein BD779DRAFT_351145 [Infundibulicybe gibba]|nr:hypothetical protein BD779DRAFT_351145 [Infundibulicybe gibba]